MPRFFQHWHILMLLLVSAGCAGPIETRVQSQSSAAVPAGQPYRFSAKPEQDTEIYREARRLVARELQSRGLSQGEGARLLVHIAIADRPASIAITAEQNTQQRVIAEQKEQKFLQSCDDREHSLKLLLIDEKSAEVVYSGSAAEYHCKGTLAQSLPHLVDAALSNLGKNTDGALRSRVLTRNGIE